MSSDEEGVPLGESLLETDLYLKSDENKFFPLKELETSFQQFGRLYLSSNTRTCFLNDEIEKFIDTGDEVLYFKGKLYYKGRANKIKKISGKIANLNLLEKVKFF